MDSQATLEENEFTFNKVDRARERQNNPSNPVLPARVVSKIGGTTYCDRIHLLLDMPSFIYWLAYLLALVPLHAVIITPPLLFKARESVHQFC